MSQYPTPSYKIDDDTVYPPSEDTFLLMDALEKERELIIKLKPSFSVEVGCGSGVVTTFLQQLLKHEDTTSCPTTSSNKLFSICTDVNRNALECTKRTFQLNSISPESMATLHCNILDPMLSRLKNSVDIFLLNPPYVPTDEEAKDEKDYYYAGGLRGRHLLDRLLPYIAQILSPDGLFFLVALRENGVDELLSVETSTKYGLLAINVLERQCRNEYLHILKFSKITDKVKQISAPSMRTLGPLLKTSATKITLLLKPVGAAPQLKKEFTKYKVDPNSTIVHLERILKKLLGIKNSESIFLFVKEAFAPSPEHTMEVLHQCFGSNNGILYIQYSLTPAWG